MSVFQGAVRAVEKTADATTAAAGAVGGAAVSTAALQWKCPNTTPDNRAGTTMDWSTTDNSNAVPQ